MLKKRHGTVDFGWMKNTPVEEIEGPFKEDTWAFCLFVSTVYSTDNPLEIGVALPLTYEDDDCLEYTQPLSELIEELLDGHRDLSGKLSNTEHDLARLMPISAELRRLADRIDTELSEGGIDLDRTRLSAELMTNLLPTKTVE